MANFLHHKYMYFIFICYVYSMLIVSLLISRLKACMWTHSFHNNRLEHMIQVMGYHPKYLECFLKTQQYMLRGDGPLPYDYRHFIAIMVSDIVIN